MPLHHQQEAAAGHHPLASPTATVSLPYNGGKSKHEAPADMKSTVSSIESSGVRSKAKSFGLHVSHPAQVRRSKHIRILATVGRIGWVGKALIYASIGGLACQTAVHPHAPQPQGATMSPQVLTWSWNAIVEHPVYCTSFGKAVNHAFLFGKAVDRMIANSKILIAYCFLGPLKSCIYGSSSSSCPSIFNSNLK
jgi:hypothetical protein